MVVDPLSGGVNPTIIRMLVDLPAPFGPRNPVTRPDRAVNETSSTAVKAPYFLVTFSRLIMGTSVTDRRYIIIGAHT